MYYVDTFTGELVKEREVIAPPERYYEYRRGIHDNVITETYVACEEPLKLLNFTHLSSEIQSPLLTSIQRDRHLKENGVSVNARLYRYIVPPKWYDEEVAKHERSTNEEVAQDTTQQEIQRRLHRIIEDKAGFGIRDQYSGFSCWEPEEAYHPAEFIRVVDESKGIIEFRETAINKVFTRSVLELVIEEE